MLINKNFLTNDFGCSAIKAQASADRLLGEIERQEGR